MSASNKVIKYFIKSAPVGEHHKVIEDLVAICGDDFLQSEEVKSALHEYFEEHHQHVKLPDGQLAMVTA